MMQTQELAGFTYIAAQGTTGEAAQGAQGAQGHGEGSESPGLLLLHGTGGDEHDLLDLGAYVAPGARLISPRGRAPEGSMNRWFARHAEGVLDEQDIRRRAQELAEFLPQAADLYRIAPGSFYALGFSNGANMAAAMLLLYPQLLSGAILLRPMLPLEPENLPDLAGKAIYIAAGTQDTMIPRASTQALIELLGRAGADVKVSWAEAGHRFSLPEVDQARDWVRGRL